METSDARRANRFAVLRAFAASGITSRQEIVDESGLSKATVSRLVRALLDDGVVVQGASINGPAGGRSTQSLEFKGRSGLVCGIDIGGTTTRFVAVEQRARLVAEWRVASPRTKTAAQMADWVGDQVLDCCARAGAAGPPVTVVGVPGVVESRTGRIRHAPNLPNIEGAEFAQSLRRRLPGIQQIENDSNLALAAELRGGAAVGAQSAVMITVGTGVGAAVALDGHLLTGAHGLVGEVGMLPVSLDGTTLEDVVSGAAICTAAVRLGLEDTSPAGVLTGVLPGRPAALRERVVAALFAGCVSFCVAYEPEIIVFGGGVSASLGAVLPALRTRLEATLAPVPELAVSQLGDLAGALGAVAVGLEAGYQLLAPGVDGAYDPQVRRDLAVLVPQLNPVSRPAAGQPAMQQQ